MNLWPLCKLTHCEGENVVNEVRSKLSNSAELSCSKLSSSVELSHASTNKRVVGPMRPIAATAVKFDHIGGSR